MLNDTCHSCGSILCKGCDDPNAGLEKWEIIERLPAPQREAYKAKARARYQRDNERMRADILAEISRMPWIQRRRA